MEAIVLSATATTIKDALKFDRTKDVDEDTGTSTLFNTIIESFI